MAVPRSRARSWWPRALALVALAASLTCGGDDGGGADDHTSISGTAYWGGPVRGATVVAFQLVDGQRTLEVARTTSGTDGVFLLEAGRTYEHVEIDVIGGTYTEPTGGDVALDASTVLQGVVLDLSLGEARTGVTISPWTHLAVALGRARLAIPREDTYGLAIGKVIERLKNHLGFDPTTTPVAPASAPGSANQGPTLQGLTLAGLSQLAALAAADQGASIQSINTVALTKVLAKDAASAEALFDGNQTELLYVGATCPLPSGCSAEGPGCYASCSVHTNTLRARLGAAVRAFLLTPANGTTLDKDDLGPWLEGIRTRIDADLFGAEDVEAFDILGPAITWQAPAADATVAGTVAVEVTATDALGVMSLTVTAQTATPMPLTDTDPAPDRFAATFSTVGLPEGPLVLTASAEDVDGNPTDSPRMVVLNNVVGGTVSGVVYKGRVGGATVRVFRFENGVRGAMLGSGTTQSDGSFTNLTIADGYTGPLLVEAGFGGTYAEEAASATVTLDVAERLRTVVPAYADGGAISNLVVSPLTSFATTYLEYLQTSNQGGATVPTRWTTARGAMEAHFGVANIYDLIPLAPSEMSTFNAQARHGMVFVGLSELARAASTLGGGDGGTFGSAMNAMRVVRVLETDLADGCWDGRQGATLLYFGGTRAVTTQSTRLDLANAIAAYLADGPRNQTPYAGAADVLSQLDAISLGGGNMSPGSCAATGHLNPDMGDTFDQTLPTIAITTNPTIIDPPHVRGTFTLLAIADDNFDTRVTLAFLTGPPGVVDIDGDPTDEDATAIIDTVALVGAEGPLTIGLTSDDDSGNTGTASVTYTVDNAPPVVTVTGVAPGGAYRPPLTITYGATDSHLAGVAATLDGAGFSSGAAVTAEGTHTLVVTATDRAGNSTTETRAFTIDGTGPVITLGGVTAGGYHQPPRTITYGATDVDLQSVTATLDGNSLASGAQVTAEGGHTIVVTAADRAGNTATLTRSFTIDGIAPVITVNGVTDGSWYSTGRVVSFSQTDANPGTLSATLDGSAFSTGATVATQGAHTLVVTAVDLAGNTSTTTIAFTIDTTAPTLALTGQTPAGTVVRGLLTLTVVGSDNLMSVGSLTSNVAVTATGPSGAVTPGQVFSTLVDGSRQVVATFNSGAIGDGALVVRFDLSDRAGNPAAQLLVTRTLDNTPPTININVTDGAWYASSTTVTFSQADTNQGTTTATLDGASFSTGNTVAAEGQHVLVVSATDAAGNPATRTVTFYVDLNNPTMSLTSAPPAWVRGNLALQVIADDTMKMYGSLAMDIAVNATGPSGNVTLSPVPTTLGGGRRQVDVAIDTTAIDDASGGGTLTVRFDIVDRASRAASQLVVTRSMDNTPPVVALSPVRNQAGAMLDGFVSESTATIRGTVTPLGGSPVTVSVTLNPGAISGTVTPDAAGNWSFVTPPLSSGAFTIAVTAIDLAGNASPGPATGGFFVDRTAPTLSWETSTARDELTCNRTEFANTTSNGTYSPASANPITYQCNLAAVRDLVNTPMPRVGKFITRLASTAAADNPLLWKLRANEDIGAVGMAAAGPTIQFRVYRSGQTPPATWLDTTGIQSTGASEVRADAYALSTDWPELANHTSIFVMEMRATDRLGNVATSVTRTWDHHPLAPPVEVEYVGAAPMSSTDPLYDESIFSHSLVPGTGQAGPGAAMSGVMNNYAPRGVLEFRVFNHVDQAVNVGFFVPVPSTWTYVRRLWEKSPATNTAMSNPTTAVCPGPTGWPSPTFKARSDDTTSPYSCTTLNCECPGANWSVPVNSTPGPTTDLFPVPPSPPGALIGTQAPVVVRAFNGDTAGVDELPWGSLQSTITSGATTYAYFEVTIPARPNANKAGWIRVLVSLRNLDRWAPHTIGAENVHNELSGILPLENVGTSLTGRFLERWVTCSDVDPDTNSCISLSLLRRIRALVEARFEVPALAARLDVRSRATNASTSEPELLPGVSDNDIFNTASVRWHTCENPGFVSGGTCTPSAP